MFIRRRKPLHLYPLCIRLSKSRFNDERVHSVARIHRMIQSSVYSLKGIPSAISLHRINTCALNKRCVYSANHGPPGKIPSNCVLNGKYRSLAHRIRLLQPFKGHFGDWDGDWQGNIAMSRLKPGFPENGYCDPTWSLPLILLLLFHSLYYFHKSALHKNS